MSQCMLSTVTLINQNMNHQLFVLNSTNLAQVFLLQVPMALPQSPHDHHYCLDDLHSHG